MLDSWEKVIDPNFVSAEIIGSVGSEKVVTITGIDYAECFDDKTKAKVQKQTVFFKESKPLVLNKTNAKKLKKLFSPNSDNPADCIGHRVKLVVETTKVAGKVVDCIRIHEFSEIKCEDCGNVILPAAGRTVDQLIEMSMKNCEKKKLCLACMKKWKAEHTESEVKHE